MVAAQTIHVDIANTSGIEDGTVEHPFNTIQEALSPAQNGDSLSIAPGTYAEGRLLIEACVAIAGHDRGSTIVDGMFVLSTHLDSLPVSITRLWCQNVMHSDSGVTMTPLAVEDCGLQVFNDSTASVSMPGSVLLKNCTVTDSIRVWNAACSAPREITNCQSSGGLKVHATSSHGDIIRIHGNQVQGSIEVTAVSKSDTIYVTNNTVGDSLVVTATASSEPNIVTANTIGHGARMEAVASDGFQLRGNLILSGSLSMQFTALSSSDVTTNDFLNGGIDLRAVSADFVAEGNRICTDGTVNGVRLHTTAGGEIVDNTITLPYVPPTGEPFESDTSGICGVRVRAVSYTGTRGNTIQGGTYGVYTWSTSSGHISGNTVRSSHHGVYLAAVSAWVDSNLVENCVADGVILSYQPDYGDTNSIRVNHNTIRNNGGHGIWTKGGLSMGSVDDPSTGFNILKTNGGYDLYVETPATFVDTVWAQNNAWTHDSEAAVARQDIYDATDDPSRARVVFMPMIILDADDGVPVPEALLRISPNPTRGRFTIEALRGHSPIARVRLLDLCGRVVASVSIPESGSDTVGFDVSDLPAGVYPVRVHPDDGSGTRGILLIKR
ncbi:right-handed parallel beta-helix repeat-containing protein [Candidatus Fermentibacteria bacterium]|nr:right-handed parallel beta-helix repeat-containing protein [Candidatus Fermentibacteria bacterium]